MKGSKFFKIFLLVIVLIFIFNQLISSLYIPVKTENAVFYTANDGFKITGQIIRQETLITSNSDGVLHFITQDGTRVSKNGVIANIYSDSNASVTVSQIDSLKSQIADIEDILCYNDIEAANLELINSKISSALSQVVFSSGGGNYAETEELTEVLLAANNRKQAALGVTSGLSERLESLKSQLSTLESQLPEIKGKVVSAQSGYFVSKTDGYENVLSTEDLDKFTPEFLNDIKPEKTPEGVIGKIVSDYEWYIAATVSLNDSLQYKEGQELKLLTAIKSSPSLAVTVKKINISEAEERAVIVFACSDMNSELATVRSGNMTVVSREYSGLKIPKKALRVVDGEKGVYVQTGMQINFVPVEVIYRNDEYLICKKEVENGNFLKLYDKVVVKGKNLYDGKIVS